MDEYIDRRKLEEAFDNADPDVCESDLDGHSDWWFGRENVRDVIRGVPAADVAPVRHGRWVLLDECYNEGVYCSACHKKVYKKCYANQKIKSKFCPNCGARMDGDGNG